MLLIKYQKVKIQFPAIQKLGRIYGEEFGINPLPSKRKVSLNRPFARKCLTKVLNDLELPASQHIILNVLQVYQNFQTYVSKSLSQKLIEKCILILSQ